MTWARSQRTRRRCYNRRVRAVAAAVLPFVAIAAIAIWEIARVSRAEDEVPGDAAWGRAAEAVRAQWKRGELIVFAPDWVDPVGRLHLGDLIPVEAAARMDAARFPGVWEVSIRGARSRDVAGETPVFEATFGGVTVRKFERPRLTLMADLVALAGRITVHGEVARKPEVVLAEVGFTPRRCVQVVPRPDRSVVMDYGRIPLGTKLVGYVGLADVFTRRDVRNPGRLTVRIDGRDVVATTVGVDDGWKRFEVETPQGMHQLEMVATAVGPGSKDRLICFAAEARR